MNRGSYECAILAIIFGFITLIFAVLLKRISKLISKFDSIPESKQELYEVKRMIEHYRNSMQIWTVIMILCTIFSRTVTQFFIIVLVFIMLVVFFKKFIHKHMIIIGIKKFKSLINKCKSLIKKYPIRTVIIIFFLLLIIPPLIINWLYKRSAIWDVMRYVSDNTVSPGDLLSYLGTLLTFCATFTLSIIIYRQNIKNNISDKLISNQSMIKIIEGSIGTIQIFDFNIPDTNPDINFTFEIIEITNSIISTIYLKSLSFKNNSYDDDSFDIISDSNTDLLLIKRRNTNSELSTGCIKITNELKALLQRRDNLTVKMKIEICCNDVITPVNITLDLLKQKMLEHNKFEYSIESIFILPSKPQIK